MREPLTAPVAGERALRSAAVLGCGTALPKHAAAFSVPVDEVNRMRCVLTKLSKAGPDELVLLRDPRTSIPGFAAMRALSTRNDKPEWLTDERYAEMTARTANSAELVAEFQAIFATQPAEYWIDAFTSHDLLAGPVNSYTDLLDDREYARLRQGIADAESLVSGVFSR